MPNFNTHWLVAIRLIQKNPGTVPDFIADGYHAYTEIVSTLSADLSAEVDKIRSLAGFQPFFRAYNKLIGDASDAILSSDNYDDITCFSAYTLGACGPDFWMLPSEADWLPVPDFAALHFDLGHYNRTHEQFNVALRRWSKMSDSLQRKVEQSYYYGMATHIAADLILHELVNVYAGAYHLLEKFSKNEQEEFMGNLAVTVKGQIWNTHNKVEHYWDSYVRYRYLGDYGPIFPRSKIGGQQEHDDDNDLMSPPLGAPTVDRLRRQITEIIDSYTKAESDELARIRENPKRGAPNDREKALLEKESRTTCLARIRHWMGQPTYVFELEQFLNLPRIACDRMLPASKLFFGFGNPRRGTVQPFIYEVAVNKQTGAYPKDEAFAELTTEAESKQMKWMWKGSTFSEQMKVRFFSSDLAMGTKVYSNNYLTYFACPNLEKVKKYANGTFFHRDALTNFVQSAVSVANVFVSDLRHACENNTSSHEKDIGSLGHFWNLDTGLGLRIENIHSDTGKEVITSLNFIHVTDLLRQPLAYTKDRTNKAYLAGRKKRTYANPGPQAAFKTYKAPKFGQLTDIRENDAEKYLDRLRVQGDHPGVTDLKIDSYFSNLAASSAKPTNVMSTNTTSVNKLQADDIKTRLTLRIDTSIIRLSETVDDEDLAFYLYADSANGIDGSAKQDPDPDKSRVTDWYKGDKNCLDFICTKGSINTDRMTESNRRHRFRSYVLLNLEEDKDATRGLGGDQPWNNVVEYEKYKKYYGRNFVMETGRSDVLKPTGAGKFMVETNFDYFANPSPTEQIFFTVHPLVRKGDKVYDAVSKTEVEFDPKDPQKALLPLRKIDCLGFVKIVLFYVMTPGGAAQVDEAYIDGLKVRVHPGA